jgi:hypothetical protein
MQLASGYRFVGKAAEFTDFVGYDELVVRIRTAAIRRIDRDQ